MKRIVANYIARHQNRWNQILHWIGVPLTFVVSVVFLVREQWLAAAAAFIGGYCLQFIGHAIEGNDAGELILLKKLRGIPYTEFGPSTKQSNFSD